MLAEVCFTETCQQKYDQRHNETDQYGRKEVQFLAHRSLCMTEALSIDSEIQGMSSSPHVAVHLSCKPQILESSCTCYFDMLFQCLFDPKQFSQECFHRNFGGLNPQELSYVGCLICRIMFISYRNFPQGLLCTRFRSTFFHPLIPFGNIHLFFFGSFKQTLVQRPYINQVDMIYIAILHFSCSCIFF